MCSEDNILSLPCPRRMTCGIRNFWTLTPLTPWVPCVKKITTFFRKSFSFELAPVICELYNSSLREGFIPPLLKSAFVRPLPKKRSAQSATNVGRPISLTYQISKVMKGLTLSRLAPAVLADLNAKHRGFQEQNMWMT